jgi:hypothetical protein
MVRQNSRVEVGDALEIEVASAKRNAFDAVFYLVVFIALAIVFHYSFPYILADTSAGKLERGRLAELEVNIFLLKELVALLAAALLTFVTISLRGVIKLWRLQNRNLRYSIKLNEAFDILRRRFVDMQQRDNIIVPARDDYRILSVANLRGLPRPIDVDWRREFGEEIAEGQDRRLYGCTMLFWPSIDDVVNSWEYVKYFSAMARFDFFRVLVTPRPNLGHEEGLRVYLELARHFSTNIYVIDQDKWYGEIAEYFCAPAIAGGRGFLRRFQKQDVTPAKLRVLELLESQIEIVTDRPLAEFTPSSDSKWLVRYLESNGLRCEHDQRTNLAQRDIVCLSSMSTIDVESRRKEISDVLNVMMTISRCYPDATMEGAADSIETLFSTAFPRSLKESIDNIAHQGAV